MEMLNILNDVVLADSETFENLRAAAGEISDYSDFKITHGYGKLIRAGVTVQKGVKATLEVSIRLTSYKQSSYAAATDTVRNHLDKNIVEHLDECEQRSDHADWWLWFHSSSESEYEHHKEQTSEQIVNTDETKIKALDQSFSGDTQEYEVKGTFEVEGLSMIPTTAFLFVEMLTITTSEGKSMNVIDSTAVAASEDGDTSKAKIDGSPKLNIVPMLTVQTGDNK